VSFLKTKNPYLRSKLEILIEVPHTGIT